MVWVPAGYEVVTDTPQESAPHLWDYLWLLWKRRWLVILTFLICTSLAAMLAFRATPVYEGVAKVRIEPDVPKVLNFEEPTYASSVDYRTDFVETQRQLIQSRPLARQVIQQLNLYDPDEEEMKEARRPLLPVGEFVAFLKSLVAPPAEPEPLDPEEAAEAEMAGRVKRFLKSLSVNQIADTQILEVRFLADDPAAAAQAANALCESYVRWNYESKVEAYRYAGEWLKQKQEDLQARLEQSEEKLYEFAGGKDILLLADNSEDLSKQLEDTGLRLATAKQDLFEKEFELKTIESATSLSLLAAANPQAAKLIEQLADLEVRYARDREVLGPKMGEIKAHEAERRRLREQLAAEYQRTLETREREVEQARAEYAFLDDLYEKQRKRIVDAQQHLIQYNIIKREVDVNQEVYNTLLQRWKRVGITSGIEPSNISLYEPAEPPGSPKLPRKKRSVLLGGFAGLFLGVMLAFFLEYMDTTVKSAEEVETLTQLPALGFLPPCGNGQARGRTEKHVELITHEDPGSAAAENVRYLRTSVLYSLPGRAPKTLLVTSAFPAEGKTTVATNLAIAFAQRGQKVLLIDADLKRPGIHRFFEQARSAGLSELLTGKSNGESIRSTHIENLSILPSGIRPPNPVDLLDSDVMRDLLVSLGEKYDHVILDSAPVLDLADTSVLVPYVDGVVLVVQPGRTPRVALRKTKEKLESIQAHLLGVVLNNPRHASDPRWAYGYGYRPYGRGYGYGHTYPYGEETPEAEPTVLPGETGFGDRLPSPPSDRAT